MRNYDLIFGIGGACCCTQALRNAGLQYASFPWDWLAESDIRTRANQLRDDFVDWLPRNSLTKLETGTYKAGDVYRNEKTRLVFAHDFPLNGSLDADYARVAERYQRRKEHLYRLIGQSKKVLVVWVDVPACPKAMDDDRRYVLEIVRTKWPQVQFDFLNFVNEEGRLACDALDSESGGVRTVTFDYKDYKEEGWVADNRLIGKWLASRYTVLDYRTPEEKKNCRKIAKKKEYGRYHAANLYQYLIAKFQYKIYNHLMKRLRRKGVI